MIQFDVSETGRDRAPADKRCRVGEPGRGCVLSDLILLRVYYDFYCPHCRTTVTLSKADALARLREIGLLKRATAENELFDEMLSTATGKLRCTSCGKPDLVIQRSTDPGGWQNPVKCERCGKVLDPERVELFPDATHCAACQAAADQGGQDAVPEYCPRCGCIMRLRQRAGQGITRYEYQCPQCRR